MTKIKFVPFIIFSFLALTACQSVSKKINEKTIQEEKELSKWLNKPESELKIVYGQPDKIEFLETRNRYYIYSSKKYGKHRRISDTGKERGGIHIFLLTLIHI